MTKKNPKKQHSYPVTVQLFRPELRFKSISKKLWVNSISLLQSFFFIFFHTTELLKNTGFFPKHTAFVA